MDHLLFFSWKMSYLWIWQSYQVPHYQISTTYSTWMISPYPLLLPPWCNWTPRPTSIRSNHSMEWLSRVLILAHENSYHALFRNERVCTCTAGNFQWLNRNSSFDSHLTWLPNLRDLKVACTKCLSLICVPSYLSWGPDGTVLLRLYCSMLFVYVGFWLQSVLLRNSTLSPDYWFHPPCWSQSGIECL